MVARYRFLVACRCNFPHHSIYTAKTKSSRRLCLNLQNFCWLWRSFGFLRALTHFGAFPFGKQVVGNCVAKQKICTNCIQNHPSVGSQSMIPSHPVSKWSGEITQIQLLDAFGRKNSSVTSSLLHLVRLCSRSHSFTWFFPSQSSSDVAASNLAGGIWPCRELQHNQDDCPVSTHQSEKFS